MNKPKRIDLQLLKWSDTSSGGQTVTFQLCDNEALEYFKQYTLKKKGIAGQLFATAFQIADDQADEPSDNSGQLKPPTVKKPRGLSQECAYWCETPKFWEFLNGFPLIITRVRGPITTEDAAIYFIYEFLKIESRRELDSEGEPREAYIRDIQAPYRSFINRE